MEAYNGHVLTLANSIIGVSILAMPYCFKQCGILLAVFILMFSNLISRLSCHFLIKSAIISRRKTFENLAYYIFGGLGKFAIEVGMIGFLLGTCIAFFVVMGDLGPEIVSEMIGSDSNGTMRLTILIVLALFCVLPLGLLRNVDSLAGVSKATIGFYFCLVMKIIIDAVPHIFYGDWTNKVEFWRPAGIIQCLPIFSMALSCQTQLFEIYQLVHNPSLEKMNHVIKKAMNICTIVYLFVGIFGYIAYSQKNFTGNILLSFTPSLLTNIIKLGFILSIAFSFPLVIFPCRASFHSLIYKQGVSIHESTNDYIPESKFKWLTFLIVCISLTIGILIPNIEFVLGLVGSSIGIMICVLFPVICFISVSQKDTNERLFAKLILAVGLVLMILGTYENLHHLREIQSTPVIIINDVIDNKDLKFMNPSMIKDSPNINNPFDTLAQTNGKIKQTTNQTKMEIVKITDSPEIRHEPPQPVEPQDSQHDANEPEKQQENMDPKLKNEINRNKNDESIEQNKKKIDSIATSSNLEDKNKLENKVHVANKVEKEKIASNEIKNKDNVDIEAIKKEVKEENLQLKEDAKDSHLEEHKILLDKIQKQNEVQEEIVKQQKKLIEVIEKQQEQKVNEEKLKAEIKAVKEIESIALKAIEKISGDIKQNEKIVAKLEKDVLQKVGANESLLKNNSSNSRLVNNQSDNMKLEELKLVNSLLSAKIKKNNMTHNNSVLNGNENKMHLDESFIGKEKLNTAFGYINKSKEYSNKTDKREILPLPLVISNWHQKNANNLNSTSKNKINDNSSSEHVLYKNASKVEEDIKVMRRDILAYSTTKTSP